MNHWKKIGKYAHHGIFCPLFSLKSKESSGIGEYLDLLPLIDWCSEIGFDVLQITPINDTENDPSPFGAVSSCALDPIYLRLPHPLPFLNDAKRLNRSEVRRLKMEGLYSSFQKEYASISKTLDYQTFLQENVDWLSEYTQFKQENPHFHQYLQYLCFSQMKQVKKRGDEKKVFIKGDLPFYFHQKSSDVLGNPSLFNRELLSGSPPDTFSKDGQKWGFPLYNWDVMRAQDFAWWKRRLKTIEPIYHIYRLDHILGFFRAWAIPIDKPAMEGHFIPENQNLWPVNGKEIIEKITSLSSLLPIGEDLGPFTPHVADILKELEICSTKVIRFEKDRKDHFIPYDHYEPLSMTTVSNFDMPPLPLWWKEYPEEAEKFSKFKGWALEKDLSLKHQFEILYDSHHTTSLFHINPLQEYLFLFPELHHEHLEEERINIPGTMLDSNWTFRFKPYIEEMISHEALTEMMKKMLFLT